MAADPDISARVSAAAAQARAQLAGGGASTPNPPTTEPADPGDVDTPTPPTVRPGKPRTSAPPPADGTDGELELDDGEGEGEGGGLEATPAEGVADDADADSPADGAPGDPPQPRALTADDATAAAEALAAGDFDALAKALGGDAAALRIPARRAKFVREQAEAAQAKAREAIEAEARTQKAIEQARRELGGIVEGVNALRTSGRKLPALEALAREARMSVREYLQAAAREHRGEGATPPRQTDPEVAELRAKLEQREQAERDRAAAEAGREREARLRTGIESRLGRHSVAKLEGYQDLVLRELRETYPGKRITSRELKAAADAIVGRARKTATQLGLTPRPPAPRRVPARPSSNGSPMSDAERLQWAMAKAREQVRQ
jgi:hypothetical protein